MGHKSGALLVSQRYDRSKAKNGASKSRYNGGGIMNGPVQATISHSDPCTLMPAFLKAIARPLSLLPGEDPEEFEAIRDVIIDDVAPQSGIEWLWTIDLIELSWDIQRYRTLRHKVLETHRQRAIEQVLLRIDCAGIPAASQEMALRHIQQNAARWQDDPQAAIEIEARLASYGFDTCSIDMEVLVQAREIFVMLESLMHSAQNRRINVLREINARRSVGRRTRHFP
jgi:hypothetical protein